MRRYPVLFLLFVALKAVASLDLRYGPSAKSCVIEYKGKKVTVTDFSLKDETHTAMHRRFTEVMKPLRVSMADENDFDKVIIDTIKTCEKGSDDIGSGSRHTASKSLRARSSAKSQHGRTVTPNNFIESLQEKEEHNFWANLKKDISDGKLYAPTKTPKTEFAKLDLGSFERSLVSEPKRGYMDLGQHWSKSKGISLEEGLSIVFYKESHYKKMKAATQKVLKGQPPNKLDREMIAVSLSFNQALRKLPHQRAGQYIFRGTSVRGLDNFTDDGVCLMNFWSLTSDFATATRFAEKQDEPAMLQIKALSHNSQMARLSEFVQSGDYLGGVSESELLMPIPQALTFQSKEQCSYICHHQSTGKLTCVDHESATKSYGYGGCFSKRNGKIVLVTLEEGSGDCADTTKIVDW